MKPRWYRALEHIIEAIALIRSYSAKRGTALNERMILDSIERRLTIIGEALVRIRNDKPELLQRISEFKSIIGFRNVAVHAYDILEEEELWDVIDRDIPVLESEVLAILSDNPSEDEA